MILVTFCFLDGEFRDAKDSRLPVTDLLFQRGIGVFDSMRTYDKRIFGMSKHLDRLRSSALQSGLDCEEILSVLPDIIHDGIAHSFGKDFKEFLIRAYITAGDVNNRGLFPKPRFFVIFEESHPVPEDLKCNGISLFPVNMFRETPEVKSTNYMAPFVSMKDASSDDFEALYVYNGDVTESASSSFFICKDNKVITPPVGKVLYSITRDFVLTLCKEYGIEVVERSISIDELRVADEAFIAASNKEILGVVKVGDFLIADGKVGTLTNRISDLFTENFHRWVD